MKAKILIANEDKNAADVLRGLLRHIEGRIKISTTQDELKTLLPEDDWTLLLCDVRMWQKYRQDFDFLAEAQSLAIPVAATADYSSLEQLDEARQNGAFASLLKPFRSGELLSICQQSLTLKRENRKRVRVVSRQAEPEEIPLPEQQENRNKTEKHLGYFIGEHPSMLELYSQIEKLATLDMTVLIRGESGTGKELVARAIHENSTRSNKPFIAVNCASLSEQLLESELFGHVKGAFTGAFKNKDGLFQAASGGTLFLDEIGSVSIGMQQALLRVLEDKNVRPVGGTESIAVNTRVIAATNEAMEERIADGRFRLDLFHRLSVLPICLPPLRERKEDISIIAYYYLEQNGCNAKLSDQTLRAMEAYGWPGNVRQLENAMLRICALLPKEETVIDLQMLPEEIRKETENIAQEEITEKEPTTSVTNAPLFPNVGMDMTLKAYLRACERHYLKLVLERHAGDKEAAARALGISLATFYRKFEEA